MGGLARFISGKSGGQGEVVSALCEGLTERGIDVHLAILNLKKRFQRESQMNEHQWREVRYQIDSEKIHLVSSAVFADNLSAYAGDPIMTAVEFQREIVNNVIKTVRARSGGKLIIHSHDWMAGGAITAYASATGLPILHTVHNVFTACLPLDHLGGISLRDISDRLYFSEMNGQTCIDCQATAIKNATMINFVGERFLREVVEDYFLDRDLVPPSVRQEVKEKYRHDAARAIINAPSSQMYPERCEALVRKYGPEDDILEAKRENLVAFQTRTGLSVNPDALLYFWPSRLDPFQKGVELLEQIIRPFVDAHPDVQIAIVADGIGNDRTHVDMPGRDCLGFGRPDHLPALQRGALAAGVCGGLRRLRGFPLRALRPDRPGGQSLRGDGHQPRYGGVPRQDPGIAAEGGRRPAGRGQRVSLPGLRRRGALVRPGEERGLPPAARRRSGRSRSGGSCGRRGRSTASAT